MAKRLDRVHLHRISWARKGHFFPKTFHEAENIGEDVLRQRHRKSDGESREIGSECSAGRTPQFMPWPLMEVCGPEVLAWSLQIPLGISQWNSESEWPIHRKEGSGR